MILRVRPGTNKTKRQAVIEEWHREQLRNALPPLIDKWEKLIGVKVRRFFYPEHENQMGQLQSSHWVDPTEHGPS
jgi:predicted metal-dependent hydrolase